jgi:Zn-dependent protease with chaperone function
MHSLRTSPRNLLESTEYASNSIHEEVLSIGKKMGCKTRYGYDECFSVFVARNILEGSSLFPPAKTCCAPNFLNARPAIFLSRAIAELSPEKRRGLLAHEIGHVILDRSLQGCMGMMRRIFMIMKVTAKVFSDRASIELCTQFIQDHPDFLDPDAEPSAPSWRHFFSVTLLMIKNAYEQECESECDLIAARGVGFDVVIEGLETFEILNEKWRSKLLEENPNIIPIRAPSLLSNHPVTSERIRLLREVKSQEFATVSP